MDEKQLLEKFAKTLGVEIQEEVLEQVVEQKKEEQAKKLKPMSEMFALTPFKKKKFVIERSQELPKTTSVEIKDTKIIIEHKVNK